MPTFANYWLKAFSSLRLTSLDTRRITIADVEGVLEKSLHKINHEKIGRSFENRPIYKLKMGRGAKNVVAWACMHGNETTSLRGWLDLFANQHIDGVEKAFASILNEFTIHFIPMLNPDGAERYTRRNAMAIDMNRDARALATPEMQCLLHLIEELKPFVAFNLHDQRNIFSDGQAPATISFLAPSMDVQRTVPQERARTMDLIGAAYNAIKPIMSGGVGRYTDEFYPTAIGERIQEMGIPTILVECGPAKKDSLRQEARMLNAIILHAVLSRESEGSQVEIDTYNSIPINKSNQADIIVRGVGFGKAPIDFCADISLLEELVLKNDSLILQYRVLDVGDLSHQIGLEEFDYATSTNMTVLNPGTLADFTLMTNKGELTFANGIKENTPTK